MRYAVLSDIHSNVEALTSVMEQLSGLQIDKVIGLGDFVGFYTNPNECLDLLRNAQIEAVTGNHDLIAMGNAEPTYCSQRAKQSILWTRDRLAPRHKPYLLELPEQRVIDDRFVLCHGSLRSPHQYVKSADQSAEMFRDFRERWDRYRICFFGHTHHPIVYSWDGREGTAVEVVRNRDVALDPSRYYLINPGSVGQSRDNDPRASFLVYDSSSELVRFHRVDYDHAACRQKALSEGLISGGPRGSGLARSLRRLLGIGKGKGVL